MAAWAGPVCAQEEGSIIWSADQKLQWHDFKGRPFITAWASAVTASGIAYQFSSMEEDGKQLLNIDIHAYFYPDGSWYQPKLCDEFILAHEQLHFDISELYARKMRKIVSETRFTANVKEEVRAIYKQVLKELGIFQNKYDYETNFSRNVEKQLQWNRDIGAALREPNGQ